MNIPDADFTRIRSLGPSGQRDGYEQFICQQVAQEPSTAGAKFVSLHGAGGDGGVECYWTLPDDTEHGWQAKYWTTHADVNKAQLTPWTHHTFDGREKIPTASRYRRPAPGQCPHPHQSPVPHHARPGLRPRDPRAGHGPAGDTDRAGVGFP